MTTAAEVLQNNRYKILPFCRDRFCNCRDFARARLRAQPSLARWARAAASPLLPAVLAQRLRTRVAPQDRLDFWRALPVTLVFLSAWALGEMMGYIRGPAR